MGEIYEYKISRFVIRKYDRSYHDTGIPGYPISTNGSFYGSDSHTGALVTAGPNIIQGRIEKGDTPGYERGGVGIVGGKVLVRMLIHNPRITDPKQKLPEDLKNAFGGVPSEYMGGGFMLIDNDRKISEAEIISRQHYKKKQQAQLDSANHVLVGNWGTSAYLIVALSLSAAEIANKLAYYSHLCLFDGGRALWLRTPHLTMEGRSPSELDPPFFALGARGTLNRIIK